MKIKNILSIILICCLILAFQSCKNNTTTPSDSNHNMTFVGKYDTPGYAEGIYVMAVAQRTVGFVADGPGGLQILDVTIPSFPNLLSNIATAGNALTICAATMNNNSFVFVSCDNQGLYIINVTNLNTPSIDTVLTYSNDRVLCSYVDTQNKNLYIGTYNGMMYIYSLSNFPSTLNLLGTYSSYGNVSILSITLNAGLAYLAEGTVGLEIVNIVNPNTPAFLSGFPANGYVFSDAKISGLYAYIAAGSRLINLNINDPFHPQFVTSYSNTNAGYYALAVNSSTVYAAEGNSGTEILSYATQNTPLQLGYYKTNDLALDIFYYPGNADIFIADGSDGIIILRYSN